jgi:hypothetical protein
MPDMLRWITALCLSLTVSGEALAYEAPTRDIDFKVFRNGSEIGHHRVKFTQDGERTVADVDIELSVTFASIRVFHYKHVSREIWEDGRLVSINSKTDNDGDPMELTLARSDNSVNIQGTEFTGQASGTLVPSSYWFKDTINQTQIIDTQNGRVFPVEIREVGQETIEAAGQPTVATRYSLREQIEMNLWYDDQGNWVKTSFDSDGSTIEYVLQQSAYREARSEE